MLGHLQLEKRRSHLFSASATHYEGICADGLISQLLLERRRYNRVVLRYVEASALPEGKY